jgi:hypothetical protein
MPDASCVPFCVPQPRSWLCRAKEQRNHNPRVGGSSPSSGMRRACKSALSAQEGHAEYIPRVRALWPPDSAVCRGVVSASLTFQSPGQSPGRPTQRGRAGDPPTAGPRPRTVPRSTCSRAASRARRRNLFHFVEQQSQPELLLSRLQPGQRRARSHAGAEARLRPPFRGEREAATTLPRPPLLTLSRWETQQRSELVDAAALTPGCERVRGPATHAPSGRRAGAQVETPPFSRKPAVCVGSLDGCRLSQYTNRRRSRRASQGLAEVKSRDVV